MVVFYACSNLARNVAILVWFAAMQKPIYLLKPEIGKDHVALTWMRVGAGTLGYVLAAIVGWGPPSVGLGVLVLLTILWFVLSIDRFAPCLS